MTRGLSIADKVLHTDRVIKTLSVNITFTVQSTYDSKHIMFQVHTSLPWYLFIRGGDNRVVLDIPSRIICVETKVTRSCKVNKHRHEQPQYDLYKSVMTYNFIVHT